MRKAGVTGISYRILSPLAEGAARVAVRAILSDPESRLDVVLPLSIGDYLEDFDSDGSMAEFRDLLSKRRNPRTLRSRRVGDDRHDDENQTSLRHEAYENVARYLVDHCDVPIAVWNGEPTRGPGGTGEVVQYALEQNRPVIRVWG